jgi:DNA (cytosine-5)-methyltransferase 1
MKTAKPLTLGSLFDGIGGFSLAGKYAGIRPVWASEIEPFPIRVTEKRLPEMKHYGDIHGLHGAKLEPVDMITFGSPCQDVSIAGRREGLSGGRSGLFFEAIRIIREMRETTNGEYPRWAVWENVPGALSSHNGEDFRQVLESLVRIKDPAANVPLPADGKWLPAGEIMGNGYALAWRILDAAQGWGVAQRRKRVFVVLDLAGGRAGEVLFESEGVSGYTPPGGEARKGAASGAEGSAGAAGFCYESGEASRGIGYQEEESPTLRCWKPPGVAVREPPLTLKIRSGCDGGGKGALIQHDLSATLGCHNDQTLFAPKAFGIGSASSKGMLSPNPKSGFYEAATSRTIDCNGGSASCNQGGMVVVEPKVPAYYVTACSYMQIDREVASPIMARDWKDPPVIGHESPSYCFDRACFTSGENAQYCLNVREEVAATLVAEGPSAVAGMETEYLVRRLTPLECCRLQGFPDGWTEHLETEEPGEREVARWVGVFEDWYRAQGKTARASPGKIAKWLKNPRTDSAEYKAYGNSVAVPCVFFVLAGIAWAENRGDET